MKGTGEFIVLISMRLARKQSQRAQRVPLLVLQLHGVAPLAITINWITDLNTFCLSQRVPLLVCCDGAVPLTITINRSAHHFC